MKIQQLRAEISRLEDEIDKNTKKLVGHGVAYSHGEQVRKVLVVGTGWRGSLFVQSNGLPYRIDVSRAERVL